MGMREDKQKVIQELLRCNRKYIVSESYVGNSAVYNKATNTIKPLIPKGIADKFVNKKNANHQAYKMIKQALDPDGNLKYENRAVTIEVLAFILGCDEKYIEDKIEDLAREMTIRTTIRTDAAAVEYLRKVFSGTAATEELKGFSLS